MPLPTPAASCLGHEILNLEGPDAAPAQLEGEADAQAAREAHSIIQRPVPPPHRDGKDKEAVERLTFQNLICDHSTTLN